MITGAHSIPGKTNNDVIGLNIWNQNLRKIPQGIDGDFKNIQAFQVYNSKLGTIAKEDLRQFPNLILLSILKNDVLVIDGDLLAYNRKLLNVDFISNLLLHIGENLFQGLTTLVSVNFSNNPCVSSYRATPQSIQELNRQFPILCPPIAPVSTECADSCVLRIKNLEEKHSLQIAENEQRITELEKQIREISARP